MNEITILNERELYYHNSTRKKHYLCPCIANDFACLLGAENIHTYTLNTRNPDDKVSSRWFITSNLHKLAITITEDGSSFYVPDITIRLNNAIRPVIPYDTLKLETTKNKDGFLEVTYGEYPQYAVSIGLSKELEAAFLNGEMQKTGKTYTTDSRPCFSKKKFKPLKHKEYIYQGKKYIRIKPFPNHPNIKLSNGERYYRQDFVWIEVSPITWYVDEENKLLISKDALLGGIRFNDKEQYGDRFENTEMYMFLNTYFAKDIIPSKLEEEKKEEVKESKNKSKSESLMEEIYEYCKDLPNGEELTAKIDEIANDYNEKLTKIYENKINKVPTLESISSITNELELKLNMILDDLKKHHEKYKIYFEMIDIINDYISIVNNEKKESTHDLSHDIDTIVSVCIPFLKAEDSNKLKQELLTILNNQKKEIADYLHTSSIFNHNTPSKELKYQTIDEMNLDLRKKLHPLLKDLSTSVNKRDIELEIKESMTKIINGLYAEPKNRLLSYYLSEINDVYTSIVNSLKRLPNNLQHKYQEEVANIMATPIDYNENFISITKNLMKMWLSLNKVESKIKEIEELQSSYIDVNKFKK